MEDMIRGGMERTQKGTASLMNNMKEQSNAHVKQLKGKGTSGKGMGKNGHTKRTNNRMRGMERNSHGLETHIDNVTKMAGIKGEAGKT